jgi:hypothetical protein
MGNNHGGVHVGKADDLAKFLAVHSVEVDDDVKAAALFTRLGWVIVRNCLDSDTCRSLSQWCKDHRMEYESQSHNWRRVGHWSMSADSWWNRGSPVWKVLSNERFANLMGMAVGDWSGRWHLAKFAGDYVDASCSEDQGVHSDTCRPLDLEYYWDWHANKWRVKGWRECPVAALSFAVHDIYPDGAPLRISSKDGHIAAAELVGNDPELAMRLGLLRLDRVACPMGWAIIRDVRVWHGGTKNTLDATRYMPCVLATSNHMMTASSRTCGKYRPRECLAPDVWSYAQQLPVAKRLNYLYRNS